MSDGPQHSSADNTTARQRATTTCGRLGFESRSSSVDNTTILQGTTTTTYRTRGYITRDDAENKLGYGSSTAPTAGSDSFSRDPSGSVEEHLRRAVLPDPSLLTAKNGPAPPYLMAMVKSRAVPRALRASSTARLEPPSLRTHGRQASRLFSVLAPRWWNELPLGVRTAESLAVFKRRLKTHLFVMHLNVQSETIAHPLLHSAVLVILQSFISAHRTLPTGRCPTGRCPQEAAPQDAAHRTLPTGSCPTGRCPQDAAHRTLLTA
ncbi:hypothetical protein NFI96_002670 [Prochilodus magdalenae]|nr:hypothetical protein NFI96_002670 [Prochilodus magdalenae]